MQLSRLPLLRDELIELYVRAAKRGQEVLVHRVTGALECGSKHAAGMLCHLIWGSMEKTRSDAMGREAARKG